MNELKLQNNLFILLGIAKKNKENNLEINTNFDFDQFEYQNEVISFFKKYLDKTNQNKEFLKDAFFAKKITKDLFLAIYVNRNKTFYIHLYELKTYSNNINLYLIMEEIFKKDNQINENELLIINNDLFEYPSFKHNLTKPEICLLFLMFDNLKKALALADHALGLKVGEKWIEKEYKYLFA